MSTSPPTEAATQACMASLVGSLADNKARARPPLRASGPSARRRSSPRSPRPRWRRTSSATPARPTPCLKALGADARRGRPRQRPPARTARLRAARLDRLHRRQPAGRRRADHLRGRVRRQLDRPARPAGASKILQEEGSHRVHAEAWAKRLCRAGDASARPSSAAAQTWEQAARWTGPADDPGYRAAMDAGWSATTRRASASRCAPGSSTCSPPRASTFKLDEPADWSAWDAHAAAGRRERPAAARSAAPQPSSASAVGRADHHQPVALPGLQLVLRGGARGLRRPGTVDPRDRRAGKEAVARTGAADRLQRPEVVLRGPPPRVVALLEDVVRARRGHWLGSRSSGRSGPGTGTSATRARAASAPGTRLRASWPQAAEVAMKSL